MQGFHGRLQPPPVQKPCEEIPVGFILKGALPLPGRCNSHGAQRPVPQAFLGMWLSCEIIHARIQHPFLQLRIPGACGNHRDVPDRFFPKQHLKHRKIIRTVKRHTQDRHGNFIFIAGNAGQRRFPVGCLHYLIVILKGLLHLAAVLRILIRHQDHAGPLLHPGPLLRLRLPLVHGGPFLPQERFKLSAGHGPGKKVSLYIIAADFPEPLQLFPGFHAFRDHAQVHPAGKSHNKAENPLIHRLCRLTLDKLHVQLQNINGHFIQHVQGRITASEIVHFNHEAQLTQPADGMDDLRRIFRIGALGNLQMEARRREPVPADGVKQNIRNVRVVNVGTGYVDGNGKRRISLILPFPQYCAGPVPDILIQLGDKTVLFK